MNINSSETNIDIILPNYNSYPYIKETLRSILDQTFKNWKLFIVDANSNSETKNFLKQYEKHPNIKIIWLKKNKKAGFCRNLAMRNSKSKYLAFIDSDDIWDKEKLSKQLSFMIKNKHSFTYTNYSTFKSTNENASKIIVTLKGGKEYDADIVGVDELTDLFKEESKQIKSKNFKAMKMKVGLGPKEDLKLVQAVRDSIGKDFKLMVDANHAYNLKDALYVGKGLDELDVYWFEEPVAPEDYNGYRELKQKISTSIAGGEAEFTKYGWNKLISNKCIDIA